MPNGLSRYKRTISSVVERGSRFLLLLLWTESNVCDACHPIVNLMLDHETEQYTKNYTAWTRLFACARPAQFIQRSNKFIAFQVTRDYGTTFRYRIDFIVLIFSMYIFHFRSLPFDMPFKLIPFHIFLSLFLFVWARITREYIVLSIQFTSVSTYQREKCLILSHYPHTELFVYVNLAANEINFVWIHLWQYFIAVAQKMVK